MQIEHVTNAETVIRTNYLKTEKKNGMKNQKDKATQKTH